MKRWATILGRIGTVLIAISLALLLVSLIPQTQMSRSEGSGSMSGDRIQIAHYSRNLNPQQEVQVEVTVEGTLTVYLLEIGVEREFSPDTGFDYRFNLTELQKFKEEHPDRVIWDDQVENGDYSRSYTPTRVMNATVIFYNPGPESASVVHVVAVKSSLAPGDKVRNIAYWAAPIGIVLAIPWLVNIWKQRKSK